RARGHHNPFSGPAGAGGTPCPGAGLCDDPSGRSRYSPAMSSTPLAAATSPETERAAPRAAGTVRLPPAPALLAGVGRAVWIDPEEGELISLPAGEAARRARSRQPLLCHARATAQRL